MMPTNILRMLFLCVLAGLFSGPELIAEEPRLEVPVYKFKVGEELVYKITSEEDLLVKELKLGEKARRLVIECEWHVYPMRQNDDGSWRLLIAKFVDHRLEVAGDGVVDSIKINHCVQCDMGPDGTYAYDPTMTKGLIYWCNPEEIFYPLPKAAEEVALGWRQDSLLTNHQFRFTANRTREGWVLVGLDASPEDMNRKSTRILGIKLDSESGLPVELIVESKSNWDILPKHMRQTITLVEKIQHDKAWLDVFEAQANEYFKWSQRIAKKMRLLYSVKTEREARLLIGNNLNSLRRKQESASLPIYKKLYGSLILIYLENKEIGLDEARKREVLYAKAPKEWEVQDLEGHVHRAEDYRGKVVVLISWYRIRGCGNLIPQMNALAKQYHGKDVVLLSVNYDEDITDAKEAIDLYKLRIPCLFQGGGKRALHEYFEYQGRAVVLDPTGRVSLSLEAYSESFVSDITAEIDKLLAHPVRGER